MVVDNSKEGILITNASGRIGTATLQVLCQLQSNNYRNLSINPETIYIGIESKEEDYEKDKLNNNLINFQEFPFVKFVTINLRNGVTMNDIHFLEKVKTIFIIPSTNNEKVIETMNTIDAVEIAKIPNVLLFSIIDPVEDEDRMRNQYYLFEKRLKYNHNRLNYKILRAGFFMENLSYYKDEIIYQNILSIPIGEGKIAPISVNDIGAIASKILLNFNHYSKQIYSITGNQQFSGKDIAEILSKILNRTILYEPYSLLLDTKEMREGQIQNIVDMPKTSESMLHNSYLNQNGINIRCPCHKPNNGKNEVMSLLELYQSVAHHHFNKTNSDLYQNFGWTGIDFTNFLKNLCSN